MGGLVEDGDVADQAVTQGQPNIRGGREVVGVGLLQGGELDGDAGGQEAFVVVAGLVAVDALVVSAGMFPAPADIVGEQSGERISGAGGQSLGQRCVELAGGVHGCSHQAPLLG